MKNLIRKIWQKTQTPYAHLVTITFYAFSSGLLVGNAMFGESSPLSLYMLIVNLAFLPIMITVTRLSLEVAIIQNYKERIEQIKQEMRRSQNQS